MYRFEEDIKAFSDSPGIYLFFDGDNMLIYVGKATSLRHRVRSYFAPGKRTSRPIEQHIDRVTRIEIQQTDSVLEAIIAEANAIKAHQPKYNVLGKDNKSWNYIAISKGKYPMVKTLRQYQFDRQDPKIRKQEIAHIFGPYPGLNSKAIMKILRRLFRFSTCQKDINRGKKEMLDRPCFYYQLGLCRGVCTGEIASKQYKEEVIQPLLQFLKGKKKRLIQGLVKRMEVAAKEEAFEEAARLRDQIAQLQNIHDVALLSSDMVSKGKPAHDYDPIRIEGYDISNLGASGKVGSMVVFESGEPAKDQYRKFEIKSVDGQSDVDCLEEVLTRRLRHPEWLFPTVFLIDGGLPQVNRAQQVLDAHNIKIPIVGIAKGSARKRNDLVLPKKGEWAIAHDAEAFFSSKEAFIRWIKANQTLLIRVRDEAHRFALKYQKTKRRI